MSDLGDAIKQNLGAGEDATIQVTPDALVITPAPIDPEGEGFTWNGVTYRPGDWVRHRRPHENDWGVAFQLATCKIAATFDRGNPDVNFSCRFPMGLGTMRYGDQVKFATWQDYDALMSRALEAHPLAFNPGPQLGGRTKKNDYNRLGELYTDTPIGAIDWATWKRCDKAQNGEYFKVVMCNAVLNDLEKARELSQWLRGRNDGL